MKYSYPDSMITLAAAITEASILRAKRGRKQSSSKTRMGKRFLRFNDKQTTVNRIVGIKFDNILARKYFVLIQSTQANPAPDKGN